MVVLNFLYLTWSDSYGEDIMEINTDDSSEFDTGDEYEDDFADDDDDLFPPSTVRNSGGKLSLKICTLKNETLRDSLWPSTHGEVSISNSYKILILSYLVPLNHNWPPNLGLSLKDCWKEETALNF